MVGGGGGGFCGGGGGGGGYYVVGGGGHIMGFLLQLNGPHCIKLLLHLFTHSEHSEWVKCRCNRTLGTVCLTIKW